MADRARLRAALMRPARHACRAKDAEAFAAWRTEASLALASFFPTPPDATPIDAGWSTGVTVVAEDVLHGVRLRRLHVATFGGIEALAWLAVPEDRNADRPGPAVLVHPGHNINRFPHRMFDAASHPQPPEGSHDAYQRDFDLRFFRAGYATLTIEPLGMGQRRDPDDLAAIADGHDNETYGCKLGQDLSVAFGTSLLALRVFEARRLLGVLCDTPGVDPDRVAMAGISGGGTVATVTSALDARVAAAIVSGYITTSTKSIFAMPHCTCNYVPGLFAALDIPDIAALIAPRPLLVSAGDEDPIFPKRGVDEALKTLRAAYTAAGSTDALSEDRFAGGHAWNPGPDLAFLAAHLPMSS